jgi:hypothetical protein
MMLAFYKKLMFAAFLFMLPLSLLPGASAQSGGSSTVTHGYGNFLSTFSGTHFVTPRAPTAELGFHF